MTAEDGFSPGLSVRAPTRVKVCALTTFTTGKTVSMIMNTDSIANATRSPRESAATMARPVPALSDNSQAKLSRPSTWSEYNTIRVGWVEIAIPGNMRIQMGDQPTVISRSRAPLLPDCVGFELAFDPTPEAFNW